MSEGAWVTIAVVFAFAWSMRACADCERGQTAEARVTELQARGTELVIENRELKHKARLGAAWKRLAKKERRIVDLLVNNGQLRRPPSAPRHER